jgi:hypothetical protein
MALISRVYNGIHTVYGPYNNSTDGRYRVVLYDGSRRITRQYSKLKMEIKLGRRLGFNETVAHLDDNFHNDRYSNLRVIGRIKHVKLDVIRVKRKKLNCIWCDKLFRPTNDQNRRKAGPFCGRLCTGQYGANVQNGGSKLDKKPIIKRYYKRSGNKIKTKGYR